MYKLDPPQDDGLYIPEVGEWSKDKHYFLQRYIDAFTSSMKSKNWSGLHYIDLFAGAGIGCLRDSKKLDWGSPLIAAQAPNAFTSIHLCELIKKKFDALQKRIIKYHNNAQVLNGDANELISGIVEKIPSKSLSLAFLNPYGLHLDFETLRTLASSRVDLIIFFPDHLDALRNWEHNYFDNPKSNLDKCLGTGADWRQILDKTSKDKFADKLLELYVGQIRTLRYKYFEYQRICRPSGHRLYWLIFCSQHPIAAKLWRGISVKDPDGQRTFQFPE